MRPAGGVPRELPSWLFSSSFWTCHPPITLGRPVRPSGRWILTLIRKRSGECENRSDEVDNQGDELIDMLS